MSTYNAPLPRPLSRLRERVLKKETTMHSIGIFCGSAISNDETIVEAATELGKILATNHIRLVYGGASVGIMSAIADSCLANGGKVIGVLPKFMQNREIAHPHLTELHLVDSMHERIALLVKLSDGFIALPGGIGTLDELFEVWSWQKLGLHQNPIGLLNVNHYYDKLLEFLTEMCGKHFLPEETLKKLYVAENPHTLLSKLLAHVSKDNVNQLEKT